VGVLRFVPPVRRERKLRRSYFGNDAIRVRSASSGGEISPCLQTSGVVMLACAFGIAVVKVRIRIDTVQYLDYLSYHCLNDVWPQSSPIVDRID
jgi:hypothetical protein